MTSWKRKKFPNQPSWGRVINSEKVTFPGNGVMRPWGQQSLPRDMEYRIQTMKTCRSSSRKTMRGAKLSWDPALPLGCGKHLPINAWPSCSGNSLFSSGNQSNPPPTVSGALCRSDLGGGKSKAWGRIVNFLLCSGTVSTALLSPHGAHTTLSPHCCFTLCCTLAWVFYPGQSLLEQLVNEMRVTRDLVMNTN